MYKNIISLIINPRTELFSWSIVLRRSGKNHFPIVFRADQILTCHVSWKLKEIEGKLERTQEVKSMEIQYLT